MNTQAMVERLFPMLITGDRNGARNTVHDWTEGGLAAETLTQEVYWPLLDMVNDLFRRDQLTTLAHHYATRLLRSLVDQAQACYDQADRNNRSLMLFCGDTEADDLAAQMVADLAEAGGYTVTFGGGGIAYDELLAAVQNQQPDVLLMFSSSASDAPNIRRLIDDPGLVARLAGEGVVMRITLARLRRSIGIVVIVALVHDLRVIERGTTNECTIVLVGHFKVGGDLEHFGDQAGIEVAITVVGVDVVVGLVLTLDTPQLAVGDGGIDGTGDLVVGEAELHRMSLSGYQQRQDASERKAGLGRGKT